MSLATVLTWSPLVADAFVVAALLYGLHRTRTTRKWWPPLMVLLGIALLYPYTLFTAPVLNRFSPGYVNTAVQLSIVLGLMFMTFFLRHGVLAPQRLIESLAEETSMRDRYADSIAAIVITTTPDGVVRHINRHGREVLGEKADEVLGRSWFKWLGRDDAAVHTRSGYTRFVKSRGQVDVVSEYPVPTSLGVRLISWRRSAVLNDSGELVGVISHGEDVTDKRRMESKLHFESHLLDSVKDLVTVVRPDGELVYFNRSAHAECGYTRDEYRKLLPLGWVAPEHRRQAFEQQLLAASESGERYETALLHKDGTETPYEVHSQPIDFEGQPAVMNVARDISERRKHDETISRIAFNDPLTGLANRRLLCDRLSVALAQSKRSHRHVAIAYLDVDNLKIVNDTVGHEGGDQLILAVAERLAETLRDGDTLARVGGDEFVAVLNDTETPADAITVVQRLAAALRPALLIKGQTFVTSASIGVYFADGSCTEAEALQRADRAMYVAKQAGGDTHRVYVPAMDTAISQKFTLQNELRSALEHGEFEMYYQPIVSSHSRLLAGAEALIRWHHPERGLLTPGDFILAAEECGLLRPLGMWILEESCRQLASWRGQGLIVPRISVNLAAQQLSDDTLIERLPAILEANGIDAASLELEITESAAMDDIESVTRALGRLRQMGVRLALDDFGTGHSSLERLQCLPITTLKIDKSFVDEVSGHRERQPIVDTIVVLASNLGLSVVAEGVEDECQLDYLEGFGSVEIQGYVFGKPCDAGAFSAYATGLPISVAENLPPCRLAPSLQGRRGGVRSGDQHVA